MKEKKIRNKVNWKKEASLLPGYVVITLWVLFTFIVVSWVLFASLSSTPKIFRGEVFNFEDGLQVQNYVKVWTNQNVSQYFLNSLIYTLGSCFLVLFFAAPAAYALARFKFKFNKLLQNLFVAALGIPAVMIIMPLFSVVSELGMTNSRLLMVILYLCISTPFTVFFLSGYFSNLSISYEEAAYIDGCGPVKTFWKIMLPLVQPGVVIVTIFNFITIWNEFFMALIFANDQNMRPVAVGLYSMIQSMRYTGDWAALFAAVVIVFVPTFLLYIFLSEKIIASVTSGAIKG